MTIKELLAEGFKPADAMKGSENYKKLISFIEAKGLNITETAALILDFQYYQMTEEEWDREIEARREYEAQEAMNE